MVFKALNPFPGSEVGNAISHLEQETLGFQRSVG